MTEAVATEESVAADIAAVFESTDDTPATEPESKVEPETSESKEESVGYNPFDFDEAFQAKIAALVMRDSVFNDRTQGLIRPEYFENVSHGLIVDIILGYHAKYRRTPDTVTLATLLKEAKDKRKIRSDLWPDVRKTAAILNKSDISDRDFVVEKVAAFARHQAIQRAILESVDLLEKGRFDDIDRLMKQAQEVGATNLDEYDYFTENESRTNERLDLLAGDHSLRGITTGIKKLDSLLYHKGWGRRELAIFMGGAKAGKSTALINAALSAVMEGHNVLYVTLEVAREIVGARADANLADMTMDELRSNPHTARERIAEFSEKPKIGKFKIHEFPSGTMKPSDLRRLIQHYKAQGIQFDLICVDYLDIMAPNFRTNDPIENSKSIWVDVRAIAMEEDVAMLSATQTNREGFKSSVAKAEHVAEDFNKIRTADLVISINKTEEEAKRGEARLYFAASRNQATGFSLHIKQDLAKMKFVTGVVRVE